MNWACGMAVGLAAILAGCDNKDSVDSEVKTLQARVSGLTRENAGFKTTADTLKAENTAMDRKIAALKSENIQLKRQLELAQAAAAKAATAPAAEPAVASNTMESATGIVVQGGRLPVLKTPDRPAEAEEPAAVTLKKSLADLETRIAALRTKVVLAK